MDAITLCRALVVLALATIAAPQSHAQSVVGAWTRILLKDSAGTTIQPPEPPAFVIFSANGFFSQSEIPSGRPKVNKGLAAMTRDELVSRFQRVGAWRGTYVLAGGKLTRKTVADLDPSSEGNELVQMVRFAGDTLILTRANTSVNKSEARFVRVR